MMEDTKISVVVPTYNRPQYLDKALRSVFESTYRNLEVVVVNDGGCDVKDIIDQYKVRYVYQDNLGKELGCAGPLNTGIKLCTGEFIHCLADDDMVMPNYYALAVKTLKEFRRQNERILAINSPMFEINEKDDIVGLRSLEFFYCMKNQINSSDNLQDVCLRSSNFFYAPSMFMHKSLFDNLGLFDGSFGSACDYEMWLRIIFNNYYIAPHFDFGIKYRVWTGSFTNKVENQSKIGLEYATKARDFYKRRHCHATEK